MNIFHFHNVKLLYTNIMAPIEDHLKTVLDAALLLGDFNIVCVIAEDDLNPTVHFKLKRVIFLCT